MPVNRPDTVANVNAVSRIAAGTTIVGKIESETDLRLDGDFEGSITSQGKIVIGETAQVKGDLLGNSVDMWGKIKGNIFANDTLTLKNGCVVEGDLTTTKLIVELGSVFNGKCKMGPDNTTETAPSPAQSEE